MAEGVNPRLSPKIARGIALLLLLVAVFASCIWVVDQGRQTTGSGLIIDGSDSVNAALLQHKPTVVEFGSDKCAGCREMAKILDALSREHGAQVNAVAVDALANREYLRLYQIQALPTQVFFDAAGREIGRHMGVIAKEEILRRLGIDASGSGGT
jgi:thioredoxin 1